MSVPERLASGLVVRRLIRYGVWMDRTVEKFIAARGKEGHRYVVVALISAGGGCLGWGKTIDAAWALAQQRHPDTYQRAYCISIDTVVGPYSMLCFHESWDDYQEFKAKERAKAEAVRPRPDKPADVVPFPRKRD